MMGKNVAQWAERWPSMSEILVLQQLEHELK